MGMLEESFAMNGLLQIILSLIFIALSWWALQAIRWDIFLAKPDSPQAKMLIILLSILVGAAISEFFNNYFVWSSMIKYFF